MKRSILRLCEMACLLVLAQTAHAADKVTVLLTWQHQAQFVGYYAAQEKGYYADEDLEVEILPADPMTDSVIIAAAGTADVIVDWMPAALWGREQGVPLVNIAQPFKRSGIQLTCLRSSNIRTLNDLRGKKIGHFIGKHSLPLRALLFKLGLNTDPNAAGTNDLPDARLMEYGNVVFGMKSGKVDCITTMSYNEANALKAVGFRDNELVVFPFEQLGVATLEDGLYVLEGRLQDTIFADVMVRFVRASMKGWRWVEKNQPEAVSIVLDRVGDESPDVRTHQTRMLREIIELVADSDGALEVSDFERTVDILLDGGVLRKSPQNAWTSKITDRAHLYAEDRFDRLLADLAEWGKTVLLTVLDPRSSLSHIGWALFVVSMLMRDMLWLRLLVIASTLIFLTNDLFVRLDYATMSWTALLIFANLWIFWYDKLVSKFIRFTPDEDEMVRICFPALARTHCRYLLSLGEWHVADSDTVLSRRNEQLSHLYFLLSGSGVIELHGRVIGKNSPPTFIGNLAIMNMTPALWDTTVNKGARYWSITVPKLREVMENKPEIGIALRGNFARANKNYITTILEEMERDSTPRMPPSLPQSTFIDEDGEPTHR